MSRKFCDVFPLPIRCVTLGQTLYHMPNETLNQRMLFVRGVLCKDGFFFWSVFSSTQGLKNELKLRNVTTHSGN